MSTLHTVSCECGFNSLVKSGGTRADFKKESYFPHFCKTCGLVDVNTMAKSIQCPKCGSQDVVAYGTEELSDYKDKEIIPAIQCFNYKAYRYRNYCPKCKNFSLEFEPPSVFFD